MRQTDGKINTTDIVKKQYENAGNLNTRISIHSKYSANKLGFGNWIVSNYEIKPEYRILEPGCGTGDMWRGHLELFSGVSEVFSTDFKTFLNATAFEPLKEDTF